MPETFQRAGAAGMRLLSLALLLTLATASPAQQADPTPFCGEEGAWIQILGGGGPELDDNQTSASYVIHDSS